jgi:tetratricopeptide (TPR) repeat protein
MKLKQFLVVVLATFTGLLSVQSIAAPILVVGVQEPEEMKVDPFPTNKLDLSAPERMLGEALQALDKNKAASLLPALNRILEQYPDFSEGYIMRAFSLCDPGDDRAAITADLDRALKSVPNSRTGKDSVPSLLSTRAKMEVANGDFAAAMNDLQKAVLSDLDKATQFTNSGGVRPEKTASSVCVWTESDMDELVRRYPADYRSHLFRGLYFSFFVNFSPEESIVGSALDNFNKAAQLNPRSALPQLFKAELLGHMFVFNTRLNKLGWSDAGRDKLNAELVGEYTKALALDPTLKPALLSRATAELNLKKFKSAIEDYDRVLAIDPGDWVALHDRGLAKVELGNAYDAISDFSATIKLTKRELKQSHYYESRANAYMKTRQWDLAIRDFTTAISLGVGGSTLLMDVGQFRAIYPEYNAASNEAIARKLNQTFYSDLTYEGFSKDFLNGKPMPSTTIPDLYIKRSDAYLAKADWHRATTDYRRAVNGFPDYANAIDRWREIGLTADTRNYIDIKTYDDARNDSIKVWIKEGPKLGGDESPYKILRFELNCRANQIRTVSFANYDGAGQIIHSGEGGKWAGIFPESFGEMLYNGACRSH